MGDRRANPTAISFADRILALEAENAELRKRCAELASLITGDVRTPNTDMIMGAVLSGGDVMALAKKLAESKPKVKCGHVIGGSLTCLDCGLPRPGIEERMGRRPGR